MESASPSLGTVPGALSPFQREVVDFFVFTAQVLALPKSVGEIYGLLFSCEEPLPLDRIVTLLGISKGSASQGLRFLQNITAVEKVSVAGDRRDHFVAEMRLRRLATGYLRERAEPHLARTTGYLDRLEALARPDEAAMAEERIRRLRSWHKRASLLIPVIRRVLAAS